MTIKEERLTAEEYIDFLKRTDLGSQYPKERFYDRIPKLVKNVSISLVARNDEAGPRNCRRRKGHCGLSDCK